MELRDVARVQAAGRVLAGTALLVAPKAAGRGWIGDAAGDTANGVYSRALGIRDLVMGLGALRSASDPELVRPWLLAGLAADTVDLVATLLAGDELPPAGRIGVPVIAGGSALLGAVLVLKGD